MHITASDKAVAPAACPACQSTDLKTTARTIDEATYWRCRHCGEIWNVARRRDPVRGPLPHRSRFP